MIKKNMTVLTVLLACSFIGLGIVLYQIYIVPFYQNNLSQTKSISLEEDMQLVLIKNADQAHIFSIEIEVTGSSKENVDFQISNPSKSLVNSVKIKGGTLDYIYANDWYEDTCILDFKAGKNAGAKIDIEYRFIGTK